MKRSTLEEYFFKILMMASTSIVICIIISVIFSVVIKGLPALDLEMITQTPKGGYYLGKEGGILNAIIGSLYLATGATVLSIMISLPIAFYLMEFNDEKGVTNKFRIVLDILCGIPSIVYGAFMFTMMIIVGARSSLFWGMITVTLFEFPIMTRAFDEVFNKVPKHLKESSMGLGSTMWENVTQIVTRQTMPGILTSTLLSFGRAIGDAAAVLITAGYTDNIPLSFKDPVATLPLAVFFQLSSPLIEVQQRAYASGIILLFIVLIINYLTRWGSKHLVKYVVK